MKRMLVVILTVIIWTVLSAPGLFAGDYWDSDISSYNKNMFIGGGIFLGSILGIVLAVMASKKFIRFAEGWWNRAVVSASLYRLSLRDPKQPDISLNDVWLDICHRQHFVQQRNVYDVIALELYPRGLVIFIGPGDWATTQWRLTTKAYVRYYILFILLKLLSSA